MEIDIEGVGRYESQVVPRIGETITNPKTGLFVRVTGVDYLLHESASGMGVNKTVNRLVTLTVTEDFS